MDWRWTALLVHQSRKHPRANGKRRARLVEVLGYFPQHPEVAAGRPFPGPGFGSDEPQPPVEAGGCAPGSAGGLEAQPEAAAPVGSTYVSRPGRSANCIAIFSDRSITFAAPAGLSVLARSAGE